VVLDGAGEDVRNITADVVAAALERAVSACRSPAVVHAPAH
jgi:hypothetical protein